MRIRRRPQPFSLQPSDPSTCTAPQTPQNGRDFLAGAREEGGLHAGADLAQKSGAARRLALPQDNAVGSVKSVGAEQSADDVHRSLLNGFLGMEQKKDAACTGGRSEWAAKAEVNGVSAKDEENGGHGSGGGGAKKRRGPAVLMEGSRCSRVNGRGWRCSQPTLVGYSLCEHHLGKGRMRSAAAAAAAANGVRRGGSGQLGRTEHRARVPAAAGPDADESSPGRF